MLVAGRMEVGGKRDSVFLSSLEYPQTSGPAPCGTDPRLLPSSLAPSLGGVRSSTWSEITTRPCAFPVSATASLSLSLSLSALHHHLPRPHSVHHSPPGLVYNPLPSRAG